MNNAPAVSFPVGRSSFQGYFLLACGVIGLLVGGLWAHTVTAIGAAQVFFLAAFVGVLSLAARAWRKTDAGLLTWGGESWSWTTGRQAITGRVVAHFDIQSLMVVTLRDEQSRCVWLWAERASDPVRWRALRRAIYADKQTKSVRDGDPERVNVEVSL